MTLTIQKPCQHNDKFGCSITNGYNIPQVAINYVYLAVVVLFCFSIKYCYAIAIFYWKNSNTNSINFVDKIMDFNRAESTGYIINFPCASSG